MKQNILKSIAAIALITFIGSAQADFTVVNQTDATILVEPSSDAKYPSCPLDPGAYGNVVGPRRIEKFTNGAKANCFYTFKAILNPPSVPQRSIIDIPGSLSQPLQMNGTATISPDGNGGFKIQFSK